MPATLRGRRQENCHEFSDNLGCPDPKINKRTTEQGISGLRGTAILAWWLGVIPAPHTMVRTDKLQCSLRPMEEGLHGETSGAAISKPPPVLTVLGSQLSTLQSQMLAAA